WDTPTLPTMSELVLEIAVFVRPRTANPLAVSRSTGEPDGFARSSSDSRYSCARKSDWLDARREAESERSKDSMNCMILYPVEKRGYGGVGSVRGEQLVRATNRCRLEGDQGRLGGYQIHRSGKLASQFAFATFLDFAPDLPLAADTLPPPVS